jgi:hypothetical protein
MCPPLNERILNQYFGVYNIARKKAGKGCSNLFFKGADVLFRVMLKEAEARWRRQGGALFGNTPL